MGVGVYIEFVVFDRSLTMKLIVFLSQGHVVFRYRENFKGDRQLARFS